MAMIRKCRIAVALFCLLFLPTQGWSYSAIYAFGDSLSDAGNLYIADSGLLPAPPYSSGHFSNGPTWIEDMSLRLGLGPLTPSLLGGGNFAFGNARTGFPVPGASSGVPDLPQQLAMFNARFGGVAPAGALYSVWFGANEVFQIIGGFLGGMTLGDAMANTAGAAHAAADAVGFLATRGGTHFLVPLLPDLGVTPFFNATPLAPVATLLSQVFNATLMGAMPSEPGVGGADIHILDVFSALDSVVMNPSASGFINATDACYVGPQTGGGTVCAAPDRWLFWDGVHPTAMTHAMLADAGIEAIPEPGAVAILLIGLGGLMLARRPVGGRSAIPQG